MLKKDKKKIVCFMGKSGSGKSTLISDFFEKHKNEFNLNIVKSYTSRKIRENDPNDINTHIFTNMKQFFSDAKENKIISEYLSNKGYRNWTTPECFKKDSINLYAIDPLACNDFIDKYSEEFDVLPIYLKIDEISRIRRVINRDKANKNFGLFVKPEKELDLKNYTKGKARIIISSETFRTQNVEILEYYIKDWLING